MSYLLDTNVVSETRRKSPGPNMLEWLESVDEADLFISTLTMGELAKGIAKRRQTDAETADRLLHWLNGIQVLFADRIIGIDLDIALDWGEINGRKSLPVIDSLLAATARVRRLTLVARNVKDIRSMNVAYLNPWNSR